MKAGILTVVMLQASAIGCSDFHELAEHPDAGALDAHVATDAGHRDAAGDAQAPDAGPVDAHHGEASAGKEAGNDSAADVGSPPSGDFECSQPWNAPPGMGDPACGQRTVTFIEGGIVTLGGISIARTSLGTIGIAYDDEENADDQGLHIAVFPTPASTTTMIKPTILTVGFGVESHLGQTSTLAAGGPDDLLHLAYVDEDLQELLYQQIEGAAASPGSTELVTDGIGGGSYVSVAVSSTGAVRAAYFDPSTGSLSSAARNASGGFGSPSLAASGLDTTVTGAGQSSLVIDDQGTPNLLYQSAVDDVASNPRYATFASTLWSTAKTLDNAVPNGFAGYSPSLAVSGPNKYAAYYFIAQNQTPPATAELHLASWQLYSDTPQVTIQDSSIPATDPTSGMPFYAFQVALAVDKYGLLHVATVRPFANNQSGSVEYTRQAVVNGETKWLTDVIDSNVLATNLADLSSNAFVAIAVDADARPHIAYRSGNTGAVYYATRFDR